MRSVWDALIQDLRFAIRGFLRSPAFTLTALVAIAVGTGAATAVFSVVDRILFRPLPYPQEERLVSLGVTAPIESNEFMLGADYYEWRTEHAAFDGMTTWSMSRDCDMNANRPERLTCAPVEWTFLPVLGIPPMIGRNFTSDEDRPNGPKVAILTNGIWRSRFASDASIVGRTIQIDGQTTTVVGVLPASWEMPTLNNVDILVPQALNEARQQRPNTGAVLRAFARLKPGVSVDQAKAALQPYFARTLNFVPAAFRNEVFLKVRPLRDRQTEGARLASWTLLGAVAAVLLIGCANVANLLLARSVARRREFAVRAALGASRARLITQRLTESVLLGAIGGIAGWALAYGLLRAFVAIAPGGILRLEQASLDGRVFAFAAFMALVSGILFGVAPAMQRPEPEELTGARATGLRRNLLGHAILAAQIAVCVVLISAAALLLRSFWKLQNVNLGIRAANVFTVPIVLGQHQYPTPANRVQLFEEIERRTGQLPGIESFAMSDSIPPSGSVRSMIYSLIEVEGRPRVPQGTGGMAAWRAVTPGFFETLGIPIGRGRSFVESDRDPVENSMILGETLARKLLGNEDPIGKHIRTGNSGPWYTVVGIAGAIKNNGPSNPGDPEYYVVRKHMPDLGLQNRFPPDGARQAVLLVRSRMKPDAMTQWIRSSIAAVDPGLPVTIQRMEERVSRLAARPRFNAVLLSVFAGAGLLLAAIGLYGVMAFLVVQRTREIGIRMALGATRMSIIGMVMSHAGRWTAAGCLLGLAGSLSLTRVLKSLLFDAPGQDLTALAGAFVTLIAVVFVAAWLPSRRAATVDPMHALRHE